MSFMSEPTKQFNMLRSAVVEARTKGTPQAKKKARRMISSVLTSMIVNAVICSLIDMWRDPKDDDEKFLKALSDKLIGKDGNWLTGNLAGQFTGMIPFVREIFSLIEGYDVKVMAFDGVASLVKAGTKVYKYFESIANGEEPQYTPVAIGKEIVGAVGLLTGLPTKNILRELDSITTNSIEFANAHEAQYAVKKLYYNIKNYENSAVFYDLLFKVSEEGAEPDKAVYDKIYADLIAAGYGEGQISNAMKNRIKKGEDYKGGKDDLLSSIKTELESNSTYKTLDEEYQKKAIDAAKDYAAMVGLDKVSDYDVYEKSWVAKAIEAEKYGIKPSEYIAFKTVLQAKADEYEATVQEYEDQGYSDDEIDELMDSRGVTQADVEEILDGMSYLSRSDRARLWYIKYGEDNKNNPYE
jgi:hypothetical protein